MKLPNIVIIIILFLASCKPDPISSNFKQILSLNEYTIVMFIAPDCPLCHSLSTPFSELDKEYSNIQSIGVISGNYYSPMEINNFATETKFKPAIFRDYTHQIARQLNATVPPEFSLLNAKGDILYQGMMDDRIERLGSYKQQWKNNYVADAIQLINEGQLPKIKKTNPIGCSLEY